MQTPRDKVYRLLEDIKWYIEFLYARMYYIGNNSLNKKR